MLFSVFLVARQHSLLGFRIIFRKSVTIFFLRIESACEKSKEFSFQSTAESGNFDKPFFDCHHQEVSSDFSSDACFAKKHRLLDLHFSSLIYELSNENSKTFRLSSVIKILFLGDK